MMIRSDGVQDGGDPGMASRATPHDFSKQRAEVHKGMPPLDMTGQPTSWFEFWPPKVFYFPVALYWLWLSVRYRGLTLPTASNPAFPLGGLVGESKAVTLAELHGKAKERFATHVCYSRSSDGRPVDDDVTLALGALKGVGLTMPFVAKPDMGCRGAGVRLIKSDEELASYLKLYPAGHQIIFQKYIPCEAEAGIFYYRYPGQKTGRIPSLTLKYFPYVFGDGVSTVRQLIMAEPRAGKLSHLYLPRHADRLENVMEPGEPLRLAFTGSHSRGAIFRNGNAYITEEMRAAFDEVADGIPGFFFGRFDARFPSLEELQAGGEFHLMEINGAGGEVAHIWDARTKILEAYKALAEQFRVVFEIGAENRRRGHKPSSIREIYHGWREEKRLTEIYPPTE
jgi:hypothetical protein